MELRYPLLLLTNHDSFKVEAFSYVWRLLVNRLAYGVLRIKDGIKIPKSRVRVKFNTGSFTYIVRCGLHMYV